MHIKLLFRLAYRDLWFDKKITFCMITSVVAVLAPLLLLFSLKYGIVTQLSHELMSNPRNLEIKIVGERSGNHFDKPWFDEMAEMPEVQFVIPLTRALNLQADFKQSLSQFVSDVTLIPTGKNDPLLPVQVMLQRNNSVILSEVTANRLGIKSGETTNLVIRRQVDGKNQLKEIPLYVEQILPAHTINQQAAFLSLPLLIAIEQYKDGKDFDEKLLEMTPHFSIPDMKFSKARLYAKQLDDVAILAEKLNKQGIEVRTEAEAIAEVKMIDHVLNTLFLVIALISVIGAFASLAGSVMTNIERKRKEISLLALFGLNPMEIRGYLLAQAILLSSSAFVLAFLLYLFGSVIVDTVLGQFLADGVFVSHLLISHIVLAFIFTLVFSLLIAFFSSNKAIQIQPAESLREV